MDLHFEDFLWSRSKESENIRKHGVDFFTAAKAFFDPKRGIFFDSKHSQAEERFFCIAKVDGKILTVRFTHREDKIRILGAGYWRKGRRYYEETI